MGDLGPFCFSLKWMIGTSSGEDLRTATSLTMSVTPEVKSRGMKFAEEQLLKHGWTQGDPHRAPTPPNPCLPCAQGRGIVRDYPCAVHSAGEGNASLKGNLPKKMPDFSRKGQEEEEI